MARPTAQPASRHALTKQVSSHVPSVSVSTFLSQRYLWINVPEVQIGGAGVSDVM